MSKILSLLIITGLMSPDLVAKVINVFHSLKFFLNLFNKFPSINHQTL